jgi:TPR repeat protein
MKAAQQGHMNAQFWIAHAYLNGTGVAKDSARARAWFETCAAAGHALAKLALDTWPERGFDLPDEVDAARSQLQASSTVGTADSAAQANASSSLLDAPPASDKYQAAFKTYW